MAQVLSLGEREITPEDFELLLQLDEQKDIVKPGMLSAAEVDRLLMDCRCAIKGGPEMVASEDNQAKAKSRETRSCEGKKEEKEGEDGIGAEQKEKENEEQRTCGMSRDSVAENQAVVVAAAMQTARGAPPGASTIREVEVQTLPECAVCLEELPVGFDDAVQLPRCGHFFHRACLGKWLGPEYGSHTCPMCNAPINQL